MYRVLFLTVFTSLLIVSCGYQAVKPLTLAETLQPVYIRENSNVAIAVKRELLSQGIQITESASRANSVLELIDTQEARGLTVNITGRDAEYLRQSTVDFVWRSKDGTVLAADSLSSETVQIANPDEPLASRNESELIYDTLATDLAQQVTRRMHAFTASTSQTVQSATSTAE